MLATADGEPISLSEVVQFAEGERLLVTASETGTVNSAEVKAPGSVSS